MIVMRLLVLVFLGLATLPASTQDVEEDEFFERGIERDGATFATDPTARKIIGTHLEARGGVRQLHNVLTLKREGKLRLGGQESKAVWYHQAPNKLRLETTREDLGWTYRTVTATDGKRVWRQELAPKKQPAQLLEGREGKDFLREAELFGPLLDFEEKGHAFQYRGEAKVGGKRTYLVEGRLATGHRTFYYFDPKLFFVRVIGTQDTFAGRRVEVDVFQTKMKKIGSVWYPLGFSYRTGGQTYKEIEIERIEPNAPIDDALFEMPKQRERWLKD